MIAAAVSLVRRPIPGTQMSRGVKGRRLLVQYFGRQIADRRASEGDDIFTQLCKTSTEDGALLTPQEIIDHMIFLMMAAHDTLTSSLSSFVYFLAVNPRWQEKLRDEAKALWARQGRAFALRAARRASANRRWRLRRLCDLFRPLPRSCAAPCATRSLSDFEYLGALA